MIMETNKNIFMMKNHYNLFLHKNTPTQLENLQLENSFIFDKHV